MTPPTSEQLEDRRLLARDLQRLLLDHLPGLGHRSIPDAEATVIAVSALTEALGAIIAPVWWMDSQESWKQLAGECGALIATASIERIRAFHGERH